MATRLMPGAISRSKSSILLPIDASDVMKPVIFPPGRGSPATNPSPTGSVTTTNTIGIVRVSRWSAAVTGVPCARIKSGCMATNSFAKVRILLTSPPPQRTSVRRFVPSDQPKSASPCVNPKSWAFASGSFSSNDMSTPIRRDRSGFCASATNGHATVAPPSKLTNSRRLMQNAIFDLS